jgi:alkyldihydroxyacetonephosphate synthase
MSDWIADLATLLGPGIVLTDDETLDARGHDRWVVSCLRDWLHAEGKGPKMPRSACVARPVSVEQVQAIVRFAGSRAIPVIPFGLGSGVCGGVVGDPHAILLDLSGLNRVRAIDPVDLLATFEAGCNGLAAEEAVAAQGLTIGHWPQSIAISSVGGWVSTRASGQFSTAYGNIEDMVYAIDVVLPGGELVTLGKAPRASAGPDLRHIVMGAEGVMGVVTAVILSLRRAAEHQAFSAFYAKDMDAGFEAQREIVQAEWRPPVMRQYDASEVRRLFAAHAKDDQCLLIMVHEGPTARVEAELAAVKEIAARMGLSEADSAAAKDWLSHRNSVPDWSMFFKLGAIVDTIEVSGKWSDISNIYKDVIAALASIPNVLNASAHSSHVYRSGINIYCSFAYRPPELGDLEPRYFEAWDKALTATAAAGGGIAHHHGSGRLRRSYLHHDLGEGGVDLLRKLKTAVDPNGIMNPGNLLPPK